MRSVTKETNMEVRGNNNNNNNSLFSPDLSCTHFFVHDSDCDAFLL